MTEKEFGIVENMLKAAWRRDPKSLGLWLNILIVETTVRLSDAERDAISGYRNALHNAIGRDGK